MATITLCLHTRININRFSYTCVITNLRDMTKVYAVQLKFMGLVSRGPHDSRKDFLYEVRRIFGIHIISNFAHKARLK
jgi:hypothetical protein